MLAVLFESPHDPNSWLRWSFHHRNSHDNIRNAILVQQGRRLTDYPIDPIDGPRITVFLQENAQLHSDMNSATGQQSSDLLEVDFENDAQRLAWIASHAQEHRNVEFQLGL